MFSSFFQSSSSSYTCSDKLPPKTIARLVREVRDLITKSPEGAKLVIDHDTSMPSSLYDIQVEIEGPVETPYESRFFQLKLVFGNDFPLSPPRGYFLTKIYHPNVDISTGAICVNTLKKDWSPDVSLSHVLRIIRCLLIVPFPESSLNDEAGKLFMDSYDEFFRRAKLMADVHGRSYSYTQSQTIPSSKQSMKLVDKIKAGKKLQMDVNEDMSKSINDDNISNHDINVKNKNEKNTVKKERRKNLRRL